MSLQSNVKTTAQNQLTEELTMLFDSGDDSDLTVQSGNRTWKLHRLILRVGSEYFKKACNGDTFRARVVARTFFQSADLLKEGATGNIELHGDDPQMAGLMLRYFYAHDYHIDNNGKPPLGAHARMYAIADKYGIPLLKDLALANFISMIEDIEDSKIIDVSTFVAAVDIIFSSTLSSDRGLRDAIVPALVQFKSDLRDSEEFVGLIAAGLGEGDFALEVIDAWGNVGRHAEAK